MKWYIYLLNVSLFKKQVNGILVYIFDIRFSLFLLLLYKSLHLIWHRFHQNSIHFCYLFFLFWRLRIFSRELVYFHKKNANFFEWSKILRKMLIINTSGNYHFITGSKWVYKMFMLSAIINLPVPLILKVPKTFF